MSESMISLLDDETTQQENKQCYSKISTYVKDKNNSTLGIILRSMNYSMNYLTTILFLGEYLHIYPIFIYVIASMIFLLSTIYRFNKITECNENLKKNKNNIVTMSRQVYSLNQSNIFYDFLFQEISKTIYNNDKHENVMCVFNRLNIKRNRIINGIKDETTPTVPTGTTPDPGLIYVPPEHVPFSPHPINSIKPAFHYADTPEPKTDDIV